jgi:large subunit ribosomal protein L1
MATAKKNEEVKEVKTEAVEATPVKKVAEKKTAPKKEAKTPEAVLETATEETTDAPAKKVTAKAGKHSAKAIKEMEEKEAKEERKASAKVAEEKPKAPAPKTRSLLERRGKKFQETAKLVEKDKEYSLAEALTLATKTSPAKFDATVEMHVRLGVDPRHADQNIRGNLVLPAGTGRNVRVAVFADVEDATKAKKAGADIAGLEEITNALDKGNIDFDVLVSSPMMMAKLGKYARLLGPRGLMPNPKSGTVTTNVVKAVEEAKAGRVEFRVDSTGIVHLGIGKVSFGEKKLQDNANAVIASIRSAKPASVKGNYMRTMFITTTMGPSIKVSVAQ